MFDGRFRVGVDRAVKPIGTNLRRLGVSADMLTVCGLVGAIAASVAIGTGALRAGLLLVILAALPDLLDGAVAKAAGSSGPRGAFFDSVTDRVTDALLFGGVAWHLASTGSPHMAMLPFALMAGAALISYQRAKAESLGFNAKGGLMERAERVVLLCFGLLFDTILVPVLWVMLVLTLITAGQRFAKVWRQASAVRVVPERPVRRSRRVARTTSARTALRHERRQRRHRG
ncbi:MAG: phosphatidylinositol synthase [Acidimicrobiia bacterium]|nr:phosphatidylinositol synthase [Acidimicrobiia bacterium]